MCSTGIDGTSSRYQHGDCVVSVGAPVPVTHGEGSVLGREKTVLWQRGWGKAGPSSQRKSHERLVRWRSTWVGWERVVPAKGTARTKAWKQNTIGHNKCLIEYE